MKNCQRRRRYDGEIKWNKFILKKELNEVQTTLSTATPFENVTNFSSKVISAAEKIVGISMS